MSCTANEIINLAKSWVGKKKSDGSHKEIIDIYNSHKPLARGYAVKYTDAWCAAFISALSVKLGATDIIPTECSCQQMIYLFQKLGVWIEDENRTPNVADIIFYDWQDNGKGDNKGWSEHVGIVEKVLEKKITVIEGNYSNSVKRRTLDVNGRYIRGYAIPKYKVETSSNIEIPTKDYQCIHTVEKGQGLWTIAKIYLGSGLRYLEIKKLNGLKNNTIYTGQKLKIPFK